MNTNLLKAKLAENGVTQAQVAKAIGVTQSTFNKKLNAKYGAEFSQSEIDRLRVALDLSIEQVGAIFFGLKVS